MKYVLGCDHVTLILKLSSLITSRWGSGRNDPMSFLSPCFPLFIEFSFCRFLSFFLVALVFLVSPLAYNRFPIFTVWAVYNTNKLSENRQELMTTQDTSNTYIYVTWNWEYRIYYLSHLFQTENIFNHFLGPYTSFCSISHV